MSNFSMEVKHDNNDEPNPPGPKLSPAGAAELSERGGKKDDTHPWDRTGQDAAAAAAVAAEQAAEGATPAGGGSGHGVSTIVALEPEAEVSTKAFEEMQKRQKSPTDPAADVEVN